MEKLLLRPGACSGVLMDLDLGRQAPAADEAEDLGRRTGDVGAGAVDGGDASLLQELDNRNSALMRSREWPKNPRQLAGRLRRARPLLRHKGIEIEFREEGHSNARMIYFTAYPSFFGERVAPLAPLADGCPPVEAPVSEEQDLVDGEGNVIEMRPPPSPALRTNTADEVINDAPEIKRYVAIRRPQGFRRSGA